MKKLSLPLFAQNIAFKLLENSTEVYLVGGAVRDSLLEIPCKDYDFVTNLNPDQITEVFKDQDCNFVGKNFGVVIVNGVEIATFRKDLYGADRVRILGCDKVEFAKTINEDLSRRDFTVNSIAFKILQVENGDINHKIVDPFNGVQDIKDNLLKFVGNPDDRIKEDPLRMLRACRFASMFHLASTTQTALVRNAELINMVPKERIHLELLKMLNRKNSIKCIRTMELVGILQHVLPSLYKCRGIGQNKHHGETVFEHCLLTMDAIKKDKPMLKLAALLHDVGKPETKAFNEKTQDFSFLSHECTGADIIAIELKETMFSSEEIEYVTELIRKHMFFFNHITKDSAYRRLMSQLKAPVRDLLRLRIADRAGNLAKKGRPLVTMATKRTLRKIRKVEKDDNCIKMDDMEINGNDIMSILNVKPGPVIGIVKKYLFELILEKPELNNAEYLIGVVKSFVEACR